MSYSLRFQLHIIDYYLTFKYLLIYRSEEYSHLNPECYTPSSSVYCPFHPNRETRAAKLYASDEGESLYCFAESRLFKPHSLLSPPRGGSSGEGKFYSIIPYDPFWVFHSIWTHMTEQDHVYWLSQNPDSISIEAKEENPLYPLYRKGKIPLSAVLKSISQIQP